MSPKIPRILFEDNHLAVLSKPAGLLSQGAQAGDENLVEWLRAYFGRYYVGLIHRLDRNVSGLMVVAKRTKAARRLSESLRHGDIHRSYQGWVLGKLEGEAVWKHYLIKDPQKNQVTVVSKDQPGAKEASLSVHVLGYGDWQSYPCTLAGFRLKTGRPHQIRVQTAAAGFPLLGECKYAAKNAPAAKLFDRPALHAVSLEFPHPMTQEKMSFQEPLPADMKKIKIKAEN